MSKGKLLNKLHDFLNPDYYKKKRHQKELTEILKKLKKKEIKISEKIKNSSNNKEKKQLKIEFEIIHAQRKKGIDVLRASKK